MDNLALSDIADIVGAYIGQSLTRRDALDLVGAIAAATSGAPLDLDLLPPMSVGSYTLRPERLADVVREVAVLHQAHWEETEAYRHSLPFAPDYVGALDAEAAGRYLLLTARRGVDLVGNYGMWITKSRHTGTKVAQEDTMYIAPAHRRGRLFLKFSGYGELAAMTFGCAELRLTTKLTNNVGQMLPRMGYQHVANQYVKVFE